jgi:hypothetical protein
MVERRIVCRDLVGKPEGRGGIDVDGRIILEYVLNG